MRRTWYTVSTTRLRRGSLAVVTALALCLAGTAGTAAATTDSTHRNPSTALWPTFSTPKTVEVADAQGLSNEDLLTATTLQGVYNGSQKSTRLDLNYRPEDDFWLTQLPASVRVVQLPPPTSGSLVASLLQRYKSVVKGAIVVDPSNQDTVNLATTMAGLDHAVVINPDQESMVASLGITVLYSFDTAQFTGLSPVQTYQWGVDNLLPQTSTKILTSLPGSHGPDRDYAVATKQFVFSLTSTDSAQKAMMQTIVAHTPANTPIMGWVPNENADVGYLSSLGHFVTASDNMSNGTIFASIRGPSSLTQPSEPAPIAAQPNTVYVAFMASDGDNAQYMEHRMAQVWQGGDLGVIPEGWTIAPGTIDFAPTMLQYYYHHLPRNSEFDVGGSGIGYVREEGGTDLTQFAHLTSQIMKQTDIKTVDDLESLNYLDQFANDSQVSSISTGNQLLPTQLGDTTAIGQSSNWIKTPQELFNIVHQQSTETLQPNKPLFMEPLVDAWTLTPTDVLHVAQQLALAGQKQGINYVFTTPTELALTIQRYNAGNEHGLPPTNVQAMTGDQALAEPIVDPPYPTTSYTVTGSNLVANPSGQSGTTGWTTSTTGATSGGSISATTYQGGPALHWTSDVTADQSWAVTKPAVQAGTTYTFSADVAGSGQVYIDVYMNGDEATLPITLTSSYQHLTWTETAPAGTSSASLQIRSSGAGPVSVYITNASVAEATPTS